MLNNLLIKKLVQTNKVLRYQNYKQTKTDKEEVDMRDHQVEKEKLLMKRKRNKDLMKKADQLTLN